MDQEPQLTIKIVSLVMLVLKKDTLFFIYKTYMVQGFKKQDWVKNTSSNVGMIFFNISPIVSMSALILSILRNMTKRDKKKKKVKKTHKKMGIASQSNQFSLKNVHMHVFFFYHYIFLLISMQLGSKIFRYW